MLITPNNVKKTEGSFIFGGQVRAKAHSSLCAPLFAQLWQGYSFRSSELEVDADDKLCFTVGEVAPLDPEGWDHVIKVTPTGISLTSDTREGLARGFLTLIERIEPMELGGGNARLKIDCCEIKDSPDLGVRMVHVCVLPETDLLFIKRVIRVCGMLKYSHILCEFWGMLKFNCMKELAWSFGYSKEELAPLFEEARALGMEIVPMLNHWGHATGCRLASGKHVVLDQNPALQCLFSPNGWSWDIRREDVRRLHKEMRRELIKLCGEGGYFHLGCDEVYECEQDIEMTETFIEYLREVTDELMAEGRRPIIWGDMFLYDPGAPNENRYHFHCKNTDIEKILLERADRRVVIADWEYNATKKPLDTALMFKAQGFDVICCPWDNTDENVHANVDTVKDHGLFGVMHTTWHTLARGMRGMRRLLLCAERCWTKGELPSTCINYSTRMQEAWRKVYFTNGDYSDSGWMKDQLGV